MCFVFSPLFWVENTKIEPFFFACVCVWPYLGRCLSVLETDHGGPSGDRNGVHQKDGGGGGGKQLTGAIASTQLGFVSINARVLGTGRAFGRKRKKNVENNNHHHNNRIKGGTERFLQFERQFGRRGDSTNDDGMGIELAN